MEEGREEGGREGRWEGGVRELGWRKVGGGEGRREGGGREERRQWED